MGQTKRSGTVGNIEVDYTKIREDLKNISPAVAATLRNAVPENGRSATERDANQNRHINPFKLERLSNIISNNINAVTDLRAITPYIDKAELIWNTILLYPNGKQDKILTYDTQTTKLKNTVLHQELLKVWDDYFTNDYKIESELGEIINDVLWNTGSYVLFNLSRPGLDYLINGSETDPSNRSGNEAFIQQARANLSQEFVQQGNRRVMRNKGLFVRNPSVKTVSSISGLESIFGNHTRPEEQEFNIFDGDGELKEFANITLTDNPAILYLQKFNEAARDRDIDRVIGAESFDLVIKSAMQAEEKKKEAKRDKNDPLAQTQNLSEQQMTELSRHIFPDRDVKTQSLQYIKPNDALSVQPYGRGITWHVPSEAVIPIHFNGSNKKKIDYIFLLDDQGNFLKNTNDAEFYQSTRANQNAIANKNKNGSGNQLISALRTVQEGKECDFDMSEFAEMAKSSIIKRFVSSIVSGLGDNVSITIDEETNKIFLARMFKRQGVRCLYVPGEAVTYVAVKHSRLGIGQSLTQAAKMHIARLAAFDIADTLANLEGAQPHTQMTINVEKEDSDPDNTIALARAAHFDVNPRLHSLLSTAQLSVPQIVDALRESSLTVKINAGDNPYVVAPEISVDQMEKNNFKPVDDASRQQVLNQIANYFNLPKSWLDVTDEQNNFQIEAINENQMVYNQGVNWQNMFAEHLVDFMRKHIRVNAPLMNRLVNTILENKKNWVPDSKEPLDGNDETKVKILLLDFFNSVYCSFPTPNSVESTNKLVDNLEAVGKLVSAWEELSGNSNKVMEQIIATLGIDKEEFSNEEIKASIKSVFMAEAFKRYNLPMPFDDIVNDGKGGGIASLMNSILSQRRNVADFVSQYMIGRAEEDIQIVKAYKEKIEKKFAKLDEAGGATEEEEGMMGGDDSTSTSEGPDSPLEDDSSLAIEEGPDMDEGSLEDNPEDPETDQEPEDTAEDNLDEEPQEEPNSEETEEESKEPVEGSDDPESENYNPFA